MIRLVLRWENLGTIVTKTSRWYYYRLGTHQIASWAGPFGENRSLQLIFFWNSSFQNYKATFTYIRYAGYSRFREVARKLKPSQINLQISLSSEFGVHQFSLYQRWATATRSWSWSGVISFYMELESECSCWFSIWSWSCQFPTPIQLRSLAWIPLERERHQGHSVNRHVCGCTCYW